MQDKYDEIIEALKENEANGLKIISAHSAGVLISPEDLDFLGSLNVYMKPLFSELTRAIFESLKKHAIDNPEQSPINTLGISAIVQAS